MIHEGDSRKRFKKKPEHGSKFQEGDLRERINREHKDGASRGT